MLISIAILIVVLWVVVRSLKIRRHNGHIKRRLELMTLNIVPFNCRKGCGNRALTDCGSCYGCCGRCRSKDANTPSVQRAWLRNQRDKDIARMEEESNES